MPDNDTILGTMPNEAAAEWLRGKALTNARVLRDMKPEVRARAFAVSGIEDMRRLKEVREAVARIPEGGSWEEARDKVAEALGDPDSNRARAETVVRTNAFQAYSAARYRAQMADKEVFPYLKYVTVGDDRVRDSHKALDGLVLRKDDDFWKDHYPPWDWGCRCVAVELTEGMAEEEQAEGTSAIRTEEWSRRWRAAHHAADEARDFHNRPGQLTVALDEVAFDERGKERYTREEMAGFCGKMEKAAVELPDGTVKTVRDWMWEPVMERYAVETAEATAADEADKAEHAVVLDAWTGKPLARLKGRKDEIGIPDGVLPGDPRGAALVHSHPSGGMPGLSPADFMGILDVRIWRVDVVDASNGILQSVRRTTGGNAADAADMADSFDYLLDHEWTEEDKAATWDRWMAWLRAGGGGTAAFLEEETWR